MIQRTMSEVLMKMADGSLSAEGRASAEAAAEQAVKDEVTGYVQAKEYDKACRKVNSKEQADLLPG